MNNITINEQKAILAHELGHFKMKLIPKRKCFTLLGYLFGIIIQLMTLSLFSDNILLSTTFIIILLIIYYVIIKNKLFQKHERMADEFMVKVGIDKEDAINALEKLCSLNYILRKGEKGDQILKTHPSIEKRIKYLRTL